MIIRHSIRRLLLLSVLFLLPFAQSGHTAIKNSVDAINKAGMQRMLTQRLLMDYALIGQNIKYSDPATDLKEKTALFDKHLGELRDFAVDKQTETLLAKIHTLWMPVKEMLISPPKQESANDLYIKMEDLLRASHEVVVLISNASGEKAADIVNLSGRQRMLSQRMAALYALRSWGVRDVDYTPELYKTINDFKNSHAKLTNSKLTSNEIKAQLDIAAKAFKWFDMSMKMKSSKFIPSLILRSSNQILEAMNNATEMYAKT